MSVLNSLFNRATFATRCKTCLNLAISRIKLLHNKREAQLKNMRKEIFQYLQTGQEAIARIRVEHVIREENISAAYEILELFCEFVLARVPILETQRDCPTELQEAVASIIFASPRCSDLPELMQIRNLLTVKYGKEFVAAASELRPDSNVNRHIIEKLSVRAPPADVRLKTLKAIAKEYNLEWDSSSTEAEFRKKHEDLLDGTIPKAPQQLTVNSSPHPPLRNDGLSSPMPQTPIPLSSHSLSFKGELPSPLKKNTDAAGSQPQLPSPTDGKPSVTLRSSDALERARAAIASAERASAAARAAAALVNTRTALRASGVEDSS